MDFFSRLANWFSEPKPPGLSDAMASEPPAADVDPELAFGELRRAIDPARRALLEHRLYEAIDTVPKLRTFMGVHVFAVWDFMCLAKRLQRDLTSLDPLWRPPAMPEMARFINGVILGEESDDGPDHEAISHCELYLGAMDEVGAPTAPMKRFLELIADGVAVKQALEMASAPVAARKFVHHTLEVALEGDTVEVLALFLFGREDLIPEMFRRFLPRWETSGQAVKFTYYVQRHIELDGEEHGPAAHRALVALAGRDGHAWKAAKTAASGAIAARISLWDGVLDELG